MISDFEQTLLFGVTALVLVSTLAVFIWQWLRGRGRDED